MPPTDVAAIVPEPEVERLPPVPITSATALVPAVTPLNGAEVAAIVPEPLVLRLAPVPTVIAAVLLVAEDSPLNDMPVAVIVPKPVALNEAPVPMTMAAEVFVLAVNPLNGTAAALVATIVPEPVAVRLAPVPTTMAALVLVPPLIAENPIEIAAHVASPRQKVDDDADSPEFKCDTPRFPVTSAFARFTAEEVTVWVLPAKCAIPAPGDEATTQVAQPIVPLVVNVPPVIGELVATDVTVPVPVPIDCHVAALVLVATGICPTEGVPLIAIP